jgi:hypothetical protein
MFLKSPALRWLNGRWEQFFAAVLILKTGDYGGM